MSIRIDTDVPFPAGNGGPKANSELSRRLIELEVGHSLFVPADEIKPATVAHRAHSVFKRNERKAVTRRRTETIDGVEVLGTRVWRAA